MKELIRAEEKVLTGFLALCRVWGSRQDRWAIRPTAEEAAEAARFGHADLRSEIVLPSGPFTVFRQVWREGAWTSEHTSIEDATGRHVFSTEG